MIRGRSPRRLRHLQFQPLPRRHLYCPNVPPKLARITPPTCPASMPPFGRGFPCLPHTFERVARFESASGLIRPVPAGLLLSDLARAKRQVKRVSSSGANGSHTVPRLHLL